MNRKVIEQIRGRPASDGAGVKLTRVFSNPRVERFDPFLMLDEFGSEEASDYIAGFPPHPHRGFETVTYMLQGKMEHQDHMGNVGLLNDSDVQWMTAGSGIIHSEMPKQTEGKMRGFQLWVNLPAKRKMAPAHYQDVSGDKMPVYDFDFAKVKVIAGATLVNAREVSGYFDVVDTEVLYLDIELHTSDTLDINLNADHNAMVYVYDGEVLVGDSAVVTSAQTLARLSEEGNLQLKNAGKQVSRLLVLAGKPLKEPIVQHGPFVMNSREEIEQAIVDYQNGVLTA